MQTLQGGMQGMMQGIISRRPNFGAGELQLRKSVIWSSATDSNARKGALQERLEELLVLELHKDGGRAFLNFTVRGLYKHVLTAISSKITGRRERDEVNYMISKKGQRKGTLGEAITSPVVLGALASHKESESEYDDEHSKSRQDESDSTAAAQKVGDTSTIEEIGASIPEIPTPRPVMQPVSSYTQRQHLGKAENATYRERLGGYLHPRDMRRLVTPFSASNEPGLIVRRHVMLLNFDPLRAVILKDRLLVLIPDGADSILAQLEKRVRGGISEMERSFLGGTTHGSDDEIGQSGHSRTGKMRRLHKLGSSDATGSQARNQYVGASPHPSYHRKNSGDESRHSKEPDAASEAGTASTQGADEYVDTTENDDEWNELQGTEWIDLPFELQCTDAVLHTVSALLTEDTIELQDAAAKYIHRILKDKTGAQDDPLTIIRAVKEAVREMSGRVKGFVQSMNRILDEDEDMALMNLTRLQTHPERFMYPVSAEVLEEESDEPELILESYLQEGLSLINVLDSIQGQIDTAAELVDQRLDSVRNRILMANMVLTAMSVSLSVASMVGSFFGMNVPVPYEDEDTAFRKIVFGTLAGAISICVLILLSLRTSEMMPRTGLASD